MEIETIKTNKKIFFVSLVLIFSFIIGVSYSITQKIEANKDVVEGRYTININVSGLEEDKYLTGKCDDTYSLALNTEKYEFVVGSFVCNGDYAKHIYHEDTSSVELTGIKSNVDCNIKYQTKKIKVRADAINGEASPEYQYVDYGEEAVFTIRGKTYEHKYVYNTCGAVLDETSTYQRYILKDVIRPTSCTFAFYNPNGVKEYLIAAESTNPAMGGVSPSSQRVKEQETAVITVIPNEGYKYKSNNCNASYADGKLFLNNVSNSLKCSVSFTPGTTAGTTFVVSAYVSNPEGGTLYPREQIIEEYSSASIILTPNPGYVYSSNSCGAEYSGGVLKLNNVRKSTSCKVTFESKVKTVTLSASSNNENIGSVYPRSQVVNENSSGKISVSPKEGFAYYDNNCGGTFEKTSSYSNYGYLTVPSVTKNTNCVIYFDDVSKLALVEIALDDNTHGSVSASSKYVKKGSDVSFMITPYSGYIYSGNNCGGKYANGKFTLTSVKSSKKCTITFKTDNSKYTVKMVSSDTNMGTITPASRVVNAGDDAQFNYQVKEGYRYVSNNCNAEVAGLNTLILRSVSGGTTCTVHFDKE